jgi:hypothetical protein
MTECRKCKFYEPVQPLMVLDPTAVCLHKTSNVMVAAILPHSYNCECRTMRLDEDACGEKAKLFEQKQWWKIWN